jgi:hypothetical protein
MNTQTATVAAINPALEIESTNAPIVNVNNTSAMVLSGDSMEKMLKFSQMMATSKITIPKHLQGNAGDCFAIVMQAMQWGMNPFAVAQKTHLVNGVLGYEAQLVNAVINSRAPITTRLNYEWFGDWSKVNGKTDNSTEVGVTVFAIMQGESEPRTLSLSMAQVGKVRNSPLWESDPRQQLAYLATKRWSRLYCPDVILGVYTADEVEDFEPKDVTPQPTTSKTASVRDKVAAKKGQVINQEEVKRTHDCPALEKAVAAIEIAETVEDLAQLAKGFANLGLTEAEQKQINVLYKTKKQALLDAEHQANIAAFEAQEAERLANQ